MTSRLLLAIVFLGGSATGWLLQPHVSEPQAASGTTDEGREARPAGPAFGSAKTFLEFDFSALDDQSASERTKLDLVTRLARINDPSVFPRLMQEMESTEDWSQRNRAIGLLLHRWAELAPGVACDFIRDSYPPDYRRASYFAKLVDAWLLRDADAAIEALLALDAGDIQRQRILADAATKLADIDPRRAVALLEQGNFSRNSFGVGSIFAKFGKRDPSAAMSSALAMPQGRIRRVAFNGVMKSMGEVAPGRAVEMLADPDRLLPGIDQNDRRGAWSEVFTGWGKSDPAAAAEFLTSQSAPKVAVDEGVSALAQAWAKQDPAAAAEWVRGLETVMRSMERSTRSGLLDEVAGVAAKQDPDFAIERAIGSKSSSLAKSGFAALAAQDFDTAMEAYRLLVDPSVRTGAASALTDYLSRSEPEKLESFAPELLAAGGKNGHGHIARLNDSTISSLFETAPDAAEQLISSNGVMKSIAGRDPSIARRLFERLPEGSQARRDTVQSLVVKWAQGNPAEAAAWVETLPSGPARDEGAEGVADAWARIDHVAAAQWIEQLPASGARDQAAIQFTKAVAGTAPEIALRTAALIEADAGRERALGTALEGYLSQDFAAAVELIEELPVSEKLRTSLDQKIEERWAWNRLAGERP